MNVNYLTNVNIDFFLFHALCWDIFAISGKALFYFIFVVKKLSVFCFVLFCFVLQKRITLVTPANNMLLSLVGVFFYLSFLEFVVIKPELVENKNQTTMKKTRLALFVVHVVNTAIFRFVMVELEQHSVSFPCSSVRCHISFWRWSIFFSNWHDWFNEWPNIVPKSCFSNLPNTKSHFSSFIWIILPHIFPLSCFSTSPC